MGTQLLTPLDKVTTVSLALLLADPEPPCGEAGDWPRNSQRLPGPQLQPPCVSNAGHVTIPSPQQEGRPG